MRKIFGIILGLFSLSFIYAMFSTLSELNGSTVLFYLMIIAIFSYFSYRCFYKNSEKYMTIKRKKQILENTSLTEEALVELENGIIPVVNTDKLILKSDEICHYYTNATRLIIKNKVIGYSGGSSGVSLRVAKGVSLRAGKQKGTPIRGDVTEESVGQLFVTNQRMVFTSSKNSFETSLNKIVAVEMYSDGIGLQDNKTNYTIRLVSPAFPYTIIKYLAEEEQAS